MTVRDCDIAGGPVVSGFAVSFEGTEGARFVNNVVESGLAAQGIVATEADVLLLDNMITATTPCAECDCEAESCLRAAVRVEYGGYAKLEGNIITVDGSEQTVGIVVRLSGVANVTNNTVTARNTGVPAATNVSGPYDFVDGVRITSNGTVRLEGNRLFARTWGNRPATGIHLVNGSVERAANNIVHAEAADTLTFVYAVFAAEGWNGELINNTLIAGGTSFNTAVVVQLGLAAVTPSVMANNILLTTLGSGATVGVGDLGSGLDGFVSNVIFHVAKPYTVASVVTDPATLDNPGGDGARYTGNILIDPGNLSPSSVFVSLSGPDGDTATFDDNDYHLLLSSDPFGLKSAGLDVTRPGAACYGYASPLTCGAVVDDADGVARTAPVAVGALEKA